MSNLSQAKIELQVFLNFINLLKNELLKDDTSLFGNDKIKKIIKSFTIYIIDNDLDQIKSNIESNIIISDQIELFDNNQK